MWHETHTSVEQQSKAEEQTSNSLPWFTERVRTSDIFELLRDGRPRTRAQLARSTGLARSTIAARVDELIRLGMVAPHGDGISTGGRPPSLFALNPAARLVVGVDVGATHVTAILSDLFGRQLQQLDEAIDIAEGPRVVLDWVAGAVASMLAQQDRPVSALGAIGMGLPGPVEFSTGRPNNPPIMPGWDGYDVPGYLRQQHDVPVLIDNDVNIMALGEQREHLADVEDVVFIKVATGIGAGIISGGVLQRGAQGTAGDLGHVHVAGAEQAPCRCGNFGCLEAVASGPALAARLRGDGRETSSALDVVELVRAGDQAAIHRVREAGRHIGEVTATMVNLINPSVLVIGGLMAHAGEYLIAGIREVVYQRSLPLATQHLRIVTSAAGSRAAVLGAATLAIEQVLSPEAIEAASVAQGS